MQRLAAGVALVVCVTFFLIAALTGENDVAGVNLAIALALCWYLTTG